jgi:hypothetical protein
MATRAKPSDSDAFDGETAVRPPERDALFEKTTGSR